MEQESGVRITTETFRRDLELRMHEIYGTTAPDMNRMIEVLDRHFGIRAGPITAKLSVGVQPPFISAFDASSLHGLEDFGERLDAQRVSIELFANVDGLKREFAELLLFSSFAIHQLSLLDTPYQLTLALALLDNDASPFSGRYPQAPLAKVFGDDPLDAKKLNLATRSDKVRTFTVEIALGNSLRTSFGTKGFGLLPRNVMLYAAYSVLAYYRYLAAGMGSVRPSVLPLLASVCGIVSIPKPPRSNSTQQRAALDTAILSLHKTASFGTP
jgi:hypothetical protein